MLPLEKLSSLPEEAKQESMERLREEQLHRADHTTRPVVTTQGRIFRNFGR